MASKARMQTKVERGMRCLPDAPGSCQTRVFIAGALVGGSVDCSRGVRLGTRHPLRKVVMGAGQVRDLTRVGGSLGWMSLPGAERRGNLGVGWGTSPPQ